MKRRAGAMRLGRVALAGCLATTLAVTGCSFAFVRPPRDRDGPRAALRCTTSAGAPVADTLLVVVNGALLLFVASQDNLVDKPTAVGLRLTATGLWLASAVYGFYNTSRCADLQRQAHERDPRLLADPPSRDDEPARPPPTSVAPARPQGPPRLYE
jgi:hypothetical protein